MQYTYRTRSRNRNRQYDTTVITNDDQLNNKVVTQDLHQTPTSDIARVRIFTA